MATDKKRLIFSLADIRDDEEIETFVDELLDQLEVPKDAEVKKDTKQD